MGDSCCRIKFSYLIFSVIHPCDQEEKGGCEQICAKNGAVAQCSCNEGFKTSTTDPKKCEESKAPVYFI